MPRPEGVELYPGPRCDYSGCRAKDYYDEAGKSFCKNGHEVERAYYQTVEDEDDFGKVGRVTVEKKEARKKILRVFRGPKAFRLFLQAYQLVLWKQCHWLIHTQEFPPELEGLVRDLWALRLQSLDARAVEISDADEGEAQFGSQTVTDTESGCESEMKDSKSKKKKRASDAPELADTVGLCYLAAVLLRLPVSLGDFYRWIIQEEIPYFRAIKHVPMEMRERLPAAYARSLDSTAMLKCDELHKAVLELSILYQSEFEITLPSLNSPLLLFRYIQQLALPLDVYPVVQNLGKIVSFDYTFQSTYSRRRPCLAYPESQLLSLLVVAVKLCHPFDGDERTPRSITEPAAFSIDWDKWKDIYEKFDKEQRHDSKVGKQNATEVTESNIFDMNGDELDNYMDWYQKTWLETGRRFAKASTEILNFFPIDRPGRTSALGARSPTSTAKHFREMLRQVQGTLKGTNPISDEDAEIHEGSVFRPGMAYRHYRTESELPPTAKSFYEAAATVVGLSLSALTKAVFRTELRLDSWQREKRKKEKQMRMSIDEFDALSVDPMNWDEEG